MQAASLAAAHAGGPAEQLGHDPLAVAAVALLGQSVDAVAAVVGEEGVGGLQVVGQRGLGGFLSQPGVQHPGHVALLELPLQTLLEGPYQPHVPVQAHQRGSVQDGPPLRRTH